ncbi:glycosyltransferase [Candidatus Pelagibacter bacterium nBUS_49]|uniref:glycosyltransferase n=1 Tax=Candidatus Pelagibacter bacterium nBUS_49 TaxID=3374196 RepID=UPI003EBCAB44
MEILYISNSIIPSKNANSINVMKMCQAFADNNFKVTLLAPNKKAKIEKKIKDSFKFYGVKKNFFIKKLWYPDIKGGVLIYAISIFIFLLFNRKYKIVYGRFLHGCFFASLLGNQVIFESHMPENIKKNFRNFFFKHLLKSKSFLKLVVISNSLKKNYLKKKYISKKKIIVAHDGADETKNFNIKAKLLGKKKNLKVGYVGHLYKGKGMEIISLLANKINQGIEYHVIGGLSKDINLWKRKIKSKKVFFYGHISHKHITKYLNALDVCLLPNQKVVFASGAKENAVNISPFTSPLKLFEYMSHRKAIIASDLNILREILNKKNSILVEYNNVNKWIKAINKLKIRSVRENLAKQALNDFRQYSWKNRVKRIISLI